MSLDITIKERKEFHCPDCGCLVTTQDVDADYSGGRVWYDFLESVGYYVPYVENDWYGKDMELTEDQVRRLDEFVIAHKPTSYSAIDKMIARALLHGNKVVINADW